MMSTKPVNILIVDDHPIIRHGFRDVISKQPNLIIVGEAAGEAEAVSLAASKKPDLVIVDLRLKEGSGLDLVTQLRAQSPPPKVLVCSVQDEMLFAERCIRAGASGYIRKEEAVNELIEAINTVLQGKTYLSPRVAQQIVGRLAGDDSQLSVSPIETLSNRELQVFQMLGEGLSTRETAERLHLSKKTIETYRENIKEKLNLDSSRQLVKRAVMWVLEQNGSPNTQS